MKRSFHSSLIVVKSKAGVWSVSGAGAGKAYSTKVAAVKAAQEIIREGGGHLTVTNLKGGSGKSFVLGRSAMTKLNAVEGVILGQASHEAFTAFDRANATPAQRRAALKKDLSRLAVGMKTLTPVGRGASKRSEHEG